MVLAIVAAALLAGTWHLGERGNDQAVLVSIEVRSNNAAIALVDAIEALENAAYAERASARRSARTASRDALDIAYVAIDDPIEFAGERMPPQFAPTLSDFREDIAELRRDLAAAGDQPEEFAPLAARARSLYRSVSTFATNFHAEAASGADRLFSDIGRFLLGFVLLTITGITLSLLSARFVIRNIVRSIRDLTRAMRQLAGGGWR